MALAVMMTALTGTVFAADPLGTINSLSDFIFSAIKAIGLILLGFGVVQIGLSLKSHDASQRANGFLTFFGGVIIAFGKNKKLLKGELYRIFFLNILDMILIQKDIELP